MGAFLVLSPPAPCEHRVEPYGRQWTSRSADERRPEESNRRGRRRPARRHYWCPVVSAVEKLLRDGRRKPWASGGHSTAELQACACRRSLLSAEPSTEAAGDTLPPGLGTLAPALRPMRPAPGPG